MISEEENNVINIFTGMVVSAGDKHDKKNWNIILDLFERQQKTIKELQEMKKEILIDDLGGKYNIYRDNTIKELEKERDYYKKMYLEFNEGIVAGMKVIEERDKQKR